MKIRKIYTCSRSAFTQIELIFVIIIIAILGAVAIPKLAATRDDAKLSTDISNMGQCLNEASSKYVGSALNIAPGDSRACDSVECYDWQWTSDGIFKVDINSGAHTYCTEVDVVGGHLAKTYVFKGTSVSY